MVWNNWIVNARTGVKLAKVEPKPGASFSRVMNGAGRMQASFILGARSPMRVWDNTTPWARALVREWDGTVVAAALIEDAIYVEASNTLTLVLVDIRTVLDESRFPWGVNSYWLDEPNHVPGSLVISAKSHAAAGAKAVEQGLLGPSAIYSFPIVLPSTLTAGSFSEIWQNYNFKTVGDILEDIQNLGYDVDFLPRWSVSGTFEWLMRVGTAAAPRLVGGTYDFHMSAPKRELTNITYTVSGKKQLTGHIAVGQGFEVDMRVGGSGIGGAATIPARDTVESFKTETSEPMLAAFSAAAVASFQDPIEQWEMSIMIDLVPDLADLMGAVFRMHWKGNARIPDGAHDVRVISFSNSGGKKLVLDVQKWVA